MSFPRVMVTSQVGEAGWGTVPPGTIQDSALVRALLGRVGWDLGAILGRKFTFSGLAITRARSRPAGRGQVHISFKLGLTRGGGPKRFGALLVPLPEAITMAGLLLMVPEEELPARREEATLDAATKDALLEIGNVIGAAGSTALAALGAAGWSARSEGCQGVRPDVRPAFPYEEGSELVVARVSVCFDPFAPFELLLMLPPLG